MRACCGIARRIYSLKKKRQNNSQNIFINVLKNRKGKSQFSQDSFGRIYSLFVVLFHIVLWIGSICEQNYLQAILRYSVGYFFYIYCYSCVQHSEIFLEKCLFSGPLCPHKTPCPCCWKASSHHETAANAIFHRMVFVNDKLVARCQVASHCNWISRFIL